MQPLMNNTNLTSEFVTWVNSIDLRGFLMVICLLTSGSFACADEQGNRDEPILPLIANADLNPLKIKLGDSLFHDVRLSRDNSISCAGCHNLTTNGSDSMRHSTGIGGATGGIRAPTVYNSDFNFVQFWNGRAGSLEEQAGGPITSPIEMGSNWAQVIEKLKADPKTILAFSRVYADGISRHNILDAIASFERSLVTLDSSFDRWLLGDEKAISSQELEGYQLFKSYGCISCHQVKNVVGNMYAQMGEIGNYFQDRGTKLTAADRGRFEVTGDEFDRYLFKVPSLRLAALQKFFFHDSSANTLKKAIQTMGRYQLGREIPDNDVEAIEAFIKSLVGKHQRLVQP